MLRLTEAFVTDSAAGRFLRGVRDPEAPASEGPLLTGLLGLLSRARAQLLAIPALTPEFGHLTERLPELDREEALRLGGELPAAAAAEAYMKTVFGGLLSLVTASYVATAGAPEDRERHAAELERHFGSVVVGGRNIPTWIGNLNRVAREIGDTYRARSRPTARSRASTSSGAAAASGTPPPPRPGVPARHPPLPPCPAGPA